MRRLVSTSILFTVWVAATRGVSTPTVASCSLTRTTFRGWQAYRLSNGLVKLTVTPDIGGRAIQYELGSHSYFFVNPELAGRVLPREQNDRGHDCCHGCEPSGEREPGHEVSTGSSGAPRPECLHRLDQ